MRYNSYIGKNWANTAGEVNNPGSEWYIEPANSSMSLEVLKANQKKLLDQTLMWLNTMNGANRKSVINIGKILDIQNAKMADYEAIILQKETAQQQTQGGGELVIDPNTGQPVKLEPLPGETKKTNWLLIGGIALTALLIFRR